MNRDEAEAILAKARAMDFEVQSMVQRVCVEHDQPIVQRHLESRGATGVTFYLAIGNDGWPETRVRTANMSVGQLMDALNDEAMNEAALLGAFAG